MFGVPSISPDPPTCFQGVGNLRELLLNLMDGLSVRQVELPRTATDASEMDRGAHKTGEQGGALKVYSCSGGVIGDITDVDIGDDISVGTQAPCGGLGFILCDDCRVIIHNGSMVFCPRG